MTYRELLDLFLQSRSSTIVRFNEGGVNLPLAGIVARRDGNNRVSPVFIFGICKQQRKFRGL